MSGWLTALRIARREARRARGRSVLVAAMIALPVAALSFFAAQYDTFELSFVEMLLSDAVYWALGLPYDKKLFRLKVDVAALTEAEKRPLPFDWGEWLHVRRKSSV